MTTYKITYRYNDLNNKVVTDTHIKPFMVGNFLGIVIKGTETEQEEVTFINLNTVKFYTIKKEVIPDIINNEYEVESKEVIVE